MRRLIKLKENNKCKNGEKETIVVAIASQNLTAEKNWNGYIYIVQFKEFSNSNILILLFSVSNLLKNYIVWFMPEYHGGTSCMLFFVNFATFVWKIGKYQKWLFMGDSCKVK